MIRWVRRVFFSSSPLRASLFGSPPALKELPPRAGGGLARVFSRRKGERADGARRGAHERRRRDERREKEVSLSRPSKFVKPRSSTSTFSLSFSFFFSTFSKATSRLFFVFPRLRNASLAPTPTGHIFCSICFLTEEETAFALRDCAGVSREKLSMSQMFPSLKTTTSKNSSPLRPSPITCKPQTASPSSRHSST